MYSLSNLGGELGGLFTILKVLGIALFSWGGRARLMTQITNHLYKDETMNEEN
jgi:hypothetical protein